MNIIKTVREIINEVKEHNNMTFHKSLGNNVEVLPSDWLRVYKGGNCLIDELLYSCDWKDIDITPEEILNTNIDFFNTWMVGGDLSLDCVILKERYKKEYVGTELEARFV